MMILLLSYLHFHVHDEKNKTSMTFKDIKNNSMAREPGTEAGLLAGGGLPAGRGTRLTL